MWTADDLDGDAHKHMSALGKCNIFLLNDDYFAYKFLLLLLLLLVVFFFFYQIVKIQRLSWQRRINWIKKQTNKE
jgi:hypothetical protein